MKNLKRLYNALINGESPKLVLIVFPLITLLLFLTPIIFTLKSPFGLNFSDTGEIGDTIGGVVGPFIAVIAALLTFFAFWVQLKSNKAQTIQFKDQFNKASIDSFETKFFELLKLHRDNLVELELNSEIKGRASFINMYEEYKFHFMLLKSLHKIKPELDPVLTTLTEYNFIDISYRVFYMGYNGSLHGLNNSFLSEYDNSIITAYLNLVRIQKERYASEPPAVYARLVTEEQRYHVYYAKYRPFEGQSSFLSHYYRHLFHMVKFVSDQDDSLIADKYSYIKIIRSQLSSYEQLMLFYNSLTPFGSNWIEKDYLTDYRLLKNIPLSLTNFGVSPKDAFGERNKDGKLLFEWDEIHPINFSELLDKKRHNL